MVKPVIPILMECQYRDVPSALAGSRFTVMGPHHHMQDNTVVVRVLVVPMSLPPTGVNVNFNITLEQTMIGGNNGIPKISAPVIIYPARVDYL